jgi:hypothetical protein
MAQITNKKIFCLQYCIQYDMLCTQLTVYTHTYPQNIHRIKNNPSTYR